MKKIIFLSFMTIWGCDNKPQGVSRIEITQEKTEIKEPSVLSKADGLMKLKTNCYVCHNPNTESHDNMLAPPLAAVKFKYSQLYPEKELFVERMAEFVYNPTVEHAVMKGPVKRFGLMPKTALAKTEVDELILYIFNNELDFPSWFRVILKKCMVLNGHPNKVKVVYKYMLS